VDADYAGWVGKPAELDFVAMDGRRVTAEQLRGKVVLLDFWATWCGPCMQSLPHLKQTYDTFHAQGLEVVGINFDEDRAAVEAVVKDKQLPWAQHFEGRRNSLGQKFGITHYPSAWLLDRAGNVRYISALTDTDTKIKSLLAETDVEAAGRGRKHFLNRLTSGIATLRGVKDGSAVRARPNDEAAAPATNAGSADARVQADTLEQAAQRLRLRSVVVSARCSAVVFNGEAGQYVFVGDTVWVKTTNGKVELRVDRIEPGAVTLSEVKSGTELQLRVK
jgi:thiol-disulfide isomerase/thioredoxin